LEQTSLYPFFHFYNPPVGYSQLTILGYLAQFTKATQLILLVYKAYVSGKLAAVYNLVNFLTATLDHEINRAGFVKMIINEFA